MFESLMFRGDCQKKLSSVRGPLEQSIVLSRWQVVAIYSVMAVRYIQFLYILWPDAVYIRDCAAFSADVWAISHCISSQQGKRWPQSLTDAFWYARLPVFIDFVLNLASDATVKPCIC